ncbi:heme exporter protein CcmD [Candidatus Palauibacter sp.]|uniref:heme exporter protein CcmD n=1 Tax=Candidatus Palauibacter sp. TaxID=3101350 RepID=UPI003B015BFD
MNDHWLFIGAGYGITWATLGWYLLRLQRRERTAAAASRGAGEGARARGPG